MNQSRIASYLIGALIFVFIGLTSTSSLWAEESNVEKLLIAQNAILREQNIMLASIATDITEQNKYIPLIFAALCVQQNNMEYCSRTLRDIGRQMKDIRGKMSRYLSEISKPKFHVKKPAKRVLDLANCEIYARRNARGVTGSAWLQMITRNDEIQALTDACMRAKGYQVEKGEAKVSEEQKSEE